MTKELSIYGAPKITSYDLAKATLRTISPASRKKYRRSLDKFFEFLGREETGGPWPLTPKGLPINALSFVTGDRLRAWKAQLESEGLSRSSIGGHLVPIRRLAHEAYLVGAIPRRQYDSIHEVRGKSPKKGGSLLTREDAQRLLDSVKTRKLQDLRDKAVIATLLYLGLRRAELCAIRVKDIRHQGDKTFVSINGKGNKKRLLGVPPELDKLWQKWLKRSKRDLSPDSYLFARLHKNGRACNNGRLSESGVYAIVRERSERAGFQGISPHSLRRSAATAAVENGASVSSTARWLGHRGLETVMVYVRDGQDLKNGAGNYLSWEL